MEVFFVVAFRLAGDEGAWEEEMLIWPDTRSSVPAAIWFFVVVAASIWVTANYARFVGFWLFGDPPLSDVQYLVQHGRWPAEPWNPTWLGGLYVIWFCMGSLAVPAIGIQHRVSGLDTRAARLGPLGIAWVNAWPLVVFWAVYNYGTFFGYWFFEERLLEGDMPLVDARVIGQLILGAAVWAAWMIPGVLLMLRSRRGVQGISPVLAVWSVIALPYYVFRGPRK